MQVRCSLGELCATSHTGEQDLGAGSRDGFCFSSAFVQGVDDTPGGRPHGEGPYWRSGRGGGDSRCLMLRQAVRRKQPSYFWCQKSPAPHNPISRGTSSPVRPPGFKRQA